MSTPNLGLSQPDFNERGWHDDVNDNFSKLDAAITALGYPSTDGLWQVATAYEVDDRILDPALGTLWKCLVAHTSAASGTFSQDRAANPSYWVEIRSGFVWRGGWITDQAYRTQDGVFFDGSSYIALEDHTSTSFAADLGAGKWELFAAEGTGGAGSGDVNGPASAVDDNIATYDGITGKLLKDSGVAVSSLAPKASPTFTGSVTVPTQTAGNNSTLAASTAFVTGAVATAVSGILGGVSSAFDTLSELAAALSGKLTAASNLSDVANAATAFSTIKQPASTAATGVVELATDAEAIALADTSRAVTPSNLAAVLAVSTGAAQTFTGSGTWTKPAFGRFALVRVWGAGASGGKGSDSNCGAGGGGGAFIEHIFPLSSLGATETVTIGAGGAARSTGNTAGQAGGNTTFGAHLTGYGGGAGGATGGQGGGGGGQGGAGGIGDGGVSLGLGLGGASVAAVAGVASVTGGGGGGGGGGNFTQIVGGDSVFGGGGGGAGHATTGDPGKNGGNSGYGGGGGGSGGRTIDGGDGGTSGYGGAGGKGGVDSGNAVAGTAPGGGGGGSENGNSGAGAAGRCEVYVF